MNYSLHEDNGNYDGTFIYLLGWFFAVCGIVGLFSGTGVGIGTGIVCGVIGYWILGRMYAP